MPDSLTPERRRRGAAAPKAVLGYPDLIELTAQTIRARAARYRRLAVAVLGRVEFAVFATAYFLVQVPLLVGAVLVSRRVRGGRGESLPGTDVP